MLVKRTENWTELPLGVVGLLVSVRGSSVTGSTSDGCACFKITGKEMRDLFPAAHGGDSRRHVLAFLRKEGTLDGWSSENDIVVTWFEEVSDNDIPF